MIIEIYKPLIKKFGSAEECIKQEYYTIWTPKRIKAAFNFGNGTLKDFERYKKDNIAFCVYMEV